MRIQCELCPKGCVLDEGQRGDCRTRLNLEGKLRSITYGHPCSMHVDPVEKKPLFHFFPGSSVFSLATAGCNLHCKNCQNWQISQVNPEDIPAYAFTPRQIVDLTMQENCSLIAYTYTDPFAFYEYTLDISAAARENNVKNILVTAGYLNQKPLEKLYAVTDAANINLKFFDDALYRTITSATLKPVLEALVLAKEMNVWLEVTHLVIPTLNDDFSLIKKMCVWIRENLGKDTPLHFLRFYPQYLLKNLPITPVEILQRAQETAFEAGINYVYIGNVMGVGENTYCPRDKTLLIERQGYTILKNNIENGKCKTCGFEIAGRWT